MHSQTSSVALTVIEAWTASAGAQADAHLRSISTLRAGGAGGGAWAHAPASSNAHSESFQVEFFTTMSGNVFRKAFVMANLPLYSPRIGLRFTDRADPRAL
jgi:hypothetical protein